MTDKGLYLQFCEKEKEIPVFSQPWYLDAICGSNNWDILMVKKGNEIAATMPVIRKKKYGFLMRRIPPITSYLGPFFPHKFTSNKQQEKLTIALISQIPKYDFFEQNLHPTILNWLPFYWQNFEATVLYTFTIDLTKNLEKIYANIISDYRNNKFPKSKNNITITSDGKIEDLYKLQEKTFQRQGVKTPFSLSFLKKYDAAVSFQDQRAIFFARGSQGQIHAGIYLIWDNDTLYLQMAADDPKHRQTGASIYLIWHAIKFAKETLGKQHFDFMGSMIESITRVRQNFGATQKPYFNVKKINSPILNALYRLK